MTDRRRISAPDLSDHIERLSDRCVALERENERLRVVEEALGNLLARIHRDGGHYEARVGTEKAAEDAEAEWLRLRDELDEARVALLAAEKRGMLRAADMVGSKPWQAGVLATAIRRAAEGSDE